MWRKKKWFRFLFGGGWEKSNLAALDNELEFISPLLCRRWEKEILQGEISPQS